MTKYRLLRDYPNHKIGDIIQKTDSPWPIWEWEDGTPLSIDFEPHKAPDWWQKIEEEKSLDYYEDQVEITSDLKLKFHARIYWTEVLRVIAEDLNKSAQLINFKWGYVIRKNLNSGVYYPNSFQIGSLQGTVHFLIGADCQKAIDLLGPNIHHLFND